MSLAQFKQSVQVVPDLSVFPDIAAQGVEGPGRVYADGFFIQGDDVSPWCLTIGNDSVCGFLEQLEKKLYDWAVYEGYL